TEKEVSDKINYLAEKLDFKDILKRPFGRLSGGQKRRIDVARALIHNPELLILDEPTTGLDPQTRKTVWNFILSLKKETNLTVFLTTHYMEETALSDYVVILDKGKIVAKGSPLELKNEYTGDYVNVYGVSEEGVKIFNKDYEKINGGYKIEVKNTKEATDMIIAHPEIFFDYEIIKGKMDDVFLNVTGKKLTEDK
ncbi:MAG: ABC transporter ATP-binding protein, partial [Clostridia bacterium]|nr:ABC transporter ATP-binding protein [Clostridia bacterium]